tara:strand:+ start:58 stop:276 length:219 start_codon:yes stop_codon:yes gene_type:complete
MAKKKSYRKIAFTIFVDELTGDVDEVEVTKRLNEQGPLYKLDVIKNSILALDAIYKFEKYKFFEDNDGIGVA